MIRQYSDVPKTARNSIECQLGKLIKRYGAKPTRLVIKKKFDEISKEMKLVNEIEERKQELRDLENKRSKK